MVNWQHRIELVIAFLIGLVVVALVLPAFNGGSNCGGNSAALTACQTYIWVIDAWQHDHSGRPFDFEIAIKESNGELAELPGADWIRSARFLARTRDVKISPHSPKDIVIVCDRPYDNVPQGLIWPASVTHAVGYSNGEVGLISPEEFARLDKSEFVDLFLMKEKDAAATPSEL